MEKNFLSNEWIPYAQAGGYWVILGNGQVVYIPSDEEEVDDDIYTV